MRRLHWKGTGMQRYTATIFLPRTDEVFGIYPHLLEELHQSKCLVLRARDLTAFYVVGWYRGEIYRPGDLLDIYYVVSRLAELRALCVRMSFVSPGSVQVIPFDWLPPGLQPLEALDISQHGRAYRKERFLPRILPASREVKP